MSERPPAPATWRQGARDLACLGFLLMSAAIVALAVIGLYAIVRWAL